MGQADSLVFNWKRHIWIVRPGLQNTRIKGYVIVVCLLLIIKWITDEIFNLVKAEQHGLSSDTDWLREKWLKMEHWIGRWLFSLKSIRIMRVKRSLFLLSLKYKYIFIRIEINSTLIETLRKTATNSANMHIRLKQHFHKILAHSVQ